MINDVCRNNSHKEIMIINYAMKGHISCFMLMVIRINLLYNDLKNEYLLFMYSQAVPQVITFFSLSRQPIYRLHAFFCIRLELDFEFNTDVKGEFTNFDPRVIMEIRLGDLK